MARLAKKIGIFLIPFIILFILFFIFEPYDYFALKGDAIYLSKPLSSVREVMIKKPSKIIFGDSQMANLNTEYIGELTGEEYAMLGFGGAGLGESMDLFWFATENTKLEKVVFGVSFYSLGRYSDEGRIPDVLEQAKSPFKFVSRFNYWLEAINTVKYKTVNAAAKLLDKPEWLWYPEDPTAFAPQDIPQQAGKVYRKNLEDYADVIYQQVGDSYRIDPRVYERFFEIIDYCDENDIELVFVFPPVHKSIFTNVIEPRGIGDELDEAKQFFIDRAIVYDMQFVNDFTSDDDNFFDGFHLASEQKKYFAKMLFGDVDTDDVRIYR